MKWLKLALTIIVADVVAYQIKVWLDEQSKAGESRKHEWFGNVEIYGEPDGNPDVSESIYQQARQVGIPWAGSAYGVKPPYSDR